MSDEFEGVKARFSEGWTSALQRMRDIAWLISEVERLRRERGQFIADAATAVAEMRAGAVNDEQ